MFKGLFSSREAPQQGLLRRLARDRAGNTLALIAASIAPLMAMVGGGVDMGRAYLAQARLQQACDAGVLAARKRLGSEAAVTGNVPEEVGLIGQRFFNVNYRSGAYGSTNRKFLMSLEDDQAISAVANVTVPTTIMAIFGYTEVPIEVSCQAQLNFTNTDIMMVLDTTGSMKTINPGDTISRIDSLKATILSFYNQISASAGEGTTVRFGFVPYSTNVNVGGLLKSDWLVDDWTYQSREWKYTGSREDKIYDFWAKTINDDMVVLNFTAPSCPKDTYKKEYLGRTTVSDSPHEYYDLVKYSGDDYHNCFANDIGSFTVTGVRWTDTRLEEHWRYNYTAEFKQYTYTYKPMGFDVSPVKGATGDDPPVAAKITSTQVQKPSSVGVLSQTDYWYTGCIEERATYDIEDYDNVDLSRALDLDLDRVPTPGDPATQWRPQFKDLIFERSMEWDGSGTFTPAEVEHLWDYLNPGWTAEFSFCPTQASPLQEMDLSQITNYVNSLQVGGNTYHDIGMIWGGRLISPTGLFAEDNADVSASEPTSRHMIFLTDGQTEPLDVSYSSYGVEPLDQRRWNKTSSHTLKQTVEERFAFACKEVKRRNITVWLIAFGTNVNPVMAECAGPGRYFSAANDKQLNGVFSNIAKKIGKLRIER